LNETLDQAMEYSSAVGAMVIDEVAYCYERVDEGMRKAEYDLRAQTNDVDDRVDVVMESVTNVEGRVEAVVERLEVAERSMDAFDRLAEEQDARLDVHNRRIATLEGQVRDLLLFRAILQHGPENPVVVEDEEVDVEEDLVDPAVPFPVEGRLVPIEDVGEEVPAEEAIRVIVEALGGPAPVYEAPPVYDE
jgi:hypothetical protein